MTRTKLFNTLTALMLFVGNTPLKAQNDASPLAYGWNDIMTQVAKNNTSVVAAAEGLKVQQLANKADLALPDPEFEFDYGFGQPKSVPNRTNISITQTLDWGVLLGRRRKLAEMSNKQAALDYRVKLGEVMKETDRTLTSLVYYNRLCNELQQRKALADELRTLYQKKFAEGDINQIELNKVQLNAAVSLAELTRAQAERAQLVKHLQHLNGGIAVEMNDTLYPTSNSQLPALSELQQAAQASLPIISMVIDREQSRAALKVAQADALPAFTVGFAGEYVKDNNYNGLSFGFTLPLWGNARRKVKQAKAELAMRQFNIDDAKLQQAYETEEQYNEAMQLKATADQLTHNMQQMDNAHLLRRSLDLGQISLLDYLLELSFYYTARTAQLEAERDANLAISDLRATLW